jgi:replicative DNA helicase
MKDLNDRLVAGELPRDPGVKVIPLNQAAVKREEEAPPRVHTVRELVNGAAERACNPRRLEKSCATGHAELDEITGGFRPGFVWVLGADTSWGKSTFAVSVVDENLPAKRSLIVSVEDPPELYGDRILQRRAKVNAHRLMKGMCNDEEKRTIWNVQVKAEDVPCYIYAGTKPIEVIAKQLGPIIQNEGIDIIIFDYLQEFQSNQRHQDERNRFKHTSAVMRELIRSHGKTGIILSQLTINNDTKVPTKHNIRESRDVSNAAEVVAIGFAPDENVVVNGELIYEKGKKYLLIDKNKGGPPKRRVELAWNGEAACFDKVLDPEQERIERESLYYDRRAGIDEGFFDN